RGRLRGGARARPPRHHPRGLLASPVRWHLGARAGARVAARRAISVRTGALKDDSAVETLRLGATDFIVKQRLSRLVPAIRRALREREEHRNRAKAEAALKFIAEASARLASSLDLKAKLGNVAG